MRKLKIVFALMAYSTLLVGCAPRTPSIEGAWRSNRELTIAGFQDLLPRLKEKSRVTLLEKIPWGKLVQVYRNGEVAVMDGDGCRGPVPYWKWPLKDRPNDYQIGTWVKDDPNDSRVTLEGDKLVIRSALLRYKIAEVYTRVPMSEVERDFPCFSEIIWSEPSLRESSVDDTWEDEPSDEE